MRAWSFHLQIFFLGHRADQYLEAARDCHAPPSWTAASTRTPISLRVPCTTWAISAERDYLAYRNLCHELVVDGLPPPDLLIYLKAPVSVLMDRIRRRARNMETGISPDYLNLLDSFYDEWLGAFDLCPVLTIHTDDLDFVHQPGHLDTVVQRIQEKMAGKEVDPRS